MLKKFSLSLGLVAVVFAGLSIVNDRAESGAEAPHLRKILRHGFQRNSESSVSRFVRVMRRLHPEEEGENERGGLDFLQAYQKYIHDRAYPYDSVNWNAYGVAVAHREAMPAGRLGEQTRSIDPAAKWQFVGPRNLNVPYSTYFGVRPVNGRVNAIAYDPTDASVIYLAGASGGIFKTIDAGITWTAIGDQLPSLLVSSIAVDPRNPSTVYIGGGDFHGFGGFSFGLMKSIDGGANWISLPLNTPGAIPVSDILIDPEDPSLVTVTTGGSPGWIGAIYHSTDAGASWTKTTTAAYYFTSLDVSQKDGAGNRVYYAATGGTFSPASYPEVVLTSTNRGASWTVMSKPYAATTDTGYASFVAASKVNPKVVYWLVPRLQKIYRSGDQGASWTDVTNDYPMGWLDSSSGYYYNFSQWFYNFSLETAGVTIAGERKDAVFCGNIDVAFSINDGANWRSIGGPTYDSSAVIHNDQHALTVNPLNPNEVLIGCDGGIYRFVYTPSADTWRSTPLNKNLGISQFYTGAWHPTNALVMLGGTQDNAAPYSDGDILNWRNVAGGDGAGVGIDPNNTSIQYSSTQQYIAVYMTKDSWTSSQVISPPITSAEQQSDNYRVPFIGKLWMDPNNTKVLYAGTNYLYRFTASTSGGGTWAAHVGSKDLAPDNRVYKSSAISAVAVANGDSQTIYAGSDLGYLWKTTNRGTSWTDIRRSPFPNLPVMEISVNPSNKSDILVAVGGSGAGHLWRCANTAAATPVWTDLSGVGSTALPNVIVNTVERDPWQTATYYVGTDLGVFMTTDGGANWSNVSTPLGLPNVQVNQLRIVPGTGYLNAATFGRGMWRIRVKNVTSPAVSVVNLDPPTIKAGATSTGRVTLSQVSNTAYNVGLTSTTGATLSTPSISIPAGSTIGTFTATGSPTLQVDKNVTITATGANAMTASLKVLATKDAQFVSQTVPTTVSTGQSFQVKLKFTNTGSVRWTAANGFQLGAVSSGWGLSAVALGATESIANGLFKTFTFNVTAPTTPGTYNFKWRMMANGAFIGTASTPLSINVVEGDNAAWISQNMTWILGPGDVALANEVMQNTGATTWNSAEYALTSQSPLNNLTWGFKRVFLATADSIAPTQQKAFAFYVNAPDAPGSYSFQWQMFNTVTRTAFGTPSNLKKVTVTSSPDVNAQYVSQSVPTTVTVGQTFDVTITMKNNGVTSWTYGGGYRLSSWNPRSNSTWAKRQVLLLSGETIEAGASKTFSFTVRAPASAGTYNFQWRMSRQGSLWFGEPSQNVAIVVK